jgi:outer membrane protein assembly factor BamE (lipoprotein component of BamABCDE complex)
MGAAVLTRAKALVLACALAAAAGCATAGQYRSTPDIYRIRLGMSRGEVRSVMGTPRALETWGQAEFWLYAIDPQGHVVQDGENPMRTIVRVEFKDGRVTGWRDDDTDASNTLIAADGNTAKNE